MYAVVTPLTGDGFSVTDQTGTTYDFAQASGSSWLISEITDEMGLSDVFGYTGTTLTTISSSASRRALHLTWSTPSGASYPHVATVSSDPATAGQSGTALTWTYGYQGDLLTSVCSPVSATQCTTYGYITNGSHAPTAVLNANPTSYYRLDDPAGATAAANQIPVNDLSTANPPATEMGTTLGGSGPVPGASATSFNGKSSWIPLDGAWCTTPGSVSSCSTAGGTTGRVLGTSVTSEAVSLWFKTSTAGGVLISTDPAWCTSPRPSRCSRGRTSTGRWPTCPSTKSSCPAPGPSPRSACAWRCVRLPIPTQSSPPSPPSCWPSCQPTRRHEAMPGQVSQVPFGRIRI
jgi:large repetitive protein